MKCKACGATISPKMGARVARVCELGYVPKGEETILGIMCLKCIKNWDTSFVRSHGYFTGRFSIEFNRDKIKDKINSKKILAAI